jgi:hypothetical protein
MPANQIHHFTTLTIPIKVHFCPKTKQPVASHRTITMANPTASANAYHCENPNTSAVNITHQMHRTLHFPKP